MFGCMNNKATIWFLFWKADHHEVSGLVVHRKFENGRLLTFVQVDEISVEPSGRYPSTTWRSRSIIFTWTPTYSCPTWRQQKSECRHEYRVLHKSRIDLGDSTHNETILPVSDPCTDHRWHYHASIASNRLKNFLFIKNTTCFVTAHLEDCLG